MFHFGTPFPSFLQDEMAKSFAFSLKTGDFNLAMSKMPSDMNLMIEFYASWCPHCR